MREQQNEPPVRPAYIVTPQSTCPIPAGSNGLWLDSGDGNLKHRNTDGTDTVMPNEGNVQVIAVDMVAASALAANTYANGTAGLGATLTGNSAGALSSIDGQSIVVGKVILVTGEVTDSHNGPYVVSVVGDGSNPYKLTRLDIFDQSGEMLKGTVFVVKAGTTYGSTTWKYTGADNPTVGTTSLTFILAPISITYGLAGAMAAVDVAAASAGVSTAVARIDHKHQLDQSIAPTWTGNHTYTGTAAFDASGSSGTFKTSTGANTLGGDTSVSTKFTVTAASGKITKVNNESTAGIGTPYIIASGQDVASSGAGAQTTAVATAATPATGLFRVSLSISAHTNNDTVSMQVTYTDAVEGFATTLTPISSVALVHDSNTGTTSAVVIVRASAATNIVAQISASTQTTTKASATIERLQ